MTSLGYEEALNKFKEENYTPGSIHETMAKDEFFEKHGRMPELDKASGCYAANSSSFTTTISGKPLQLKSNDNNVVSIPGLNYLSNYNTYSPNLRSTGEGSLCWIKIYNSTTHDDWVLATVVKWNDTEYVTVVAHDDGIPYCLKHNELSFLPTKPLIPGGKSAS